MHRHDEEHHSRTETSKEDGAHHPLGVQTEPAVPGPVPGVHPLSAQPRPRVRQAQAQGI